LEAVPAVGVYQMLANNDPDVDAIYRLTRTLTVNFAYYLQENTPTIVLASHDQFFPFNAHSMLKQLLES